MRRSSLFLIGIVSAIATLISLNLVFGRSWNYYDRYGERRHYCNEHRDQRNHHERGGDSTTGNY